VTERFALLWREILIHGSATIEHRYR